MLDTELKIINTALLLSGEKTLSSLTRSPKRGRITDDLYEVSRDEMFDLPDDWNFLTRRKELTEAGDIPDSGYDHQYILPSDYHRLLAMIDEKSDEVEYTYRREFYEDDEETQYEVILTNENECFVKYIAARLPSEWPAWFAKLVYVDLALKIVPPLKGGAARLRTESKLQKMWDKAYKMAKEHNQSVNVDAPTGVNEDLGNNDVIDEATLGTFWPNNRCYYPRDA